jgi:methionine synthase / methylenetetrahydrofolate reductase(NADPH)
VFDVAAMERFIERTRSFAIPVIAALWPFENARNAEFMANEVPGVTVPEPLVQRMRAAGSDDAARAEGRRIAQELGAALRPMVQGLHVSAPGGDFSLALETLDGL